MIGFRLDKGTLRNHWVYGKWIYLLIVLLVIGLVELLLPMTAYRPPAEHKTDIAVVGYFSDVEPLGKISAAIMENPQAVDPVLEQVQIDGIAYSGDPETDMYGATNFQVKLGAAVYDVYFLPEALKDQLMGMEGLQPLNALASMELLSDLLPNATDGENVYAVPLASLTRLNEPDIGYDSQDKYAVVAASSKNPELAVKVLARVLNALKEGFPK